MESVTVLGGIMGLGGQEIFLVALFVLLFFGAKKIPELMRGLGQGINEFKNATKDVKENIEKSMEDTSTTTK
jgi:sec-independent protein translocase protein TatA